MPKIPRLVAIAGILSVLSFLSAAWAQRVEPVDDPGAPEEALPRAEPKAITREEYIQRMIHENELTNQRLNWLLASQTVLFAGYGTVLSANLRQQVKERVAKAAVTLGAASSLLVWLGIVAAIGASINLTTQFGSQEFSSGLLAWTNVLGWSVPFLFPILFMAAWMNLPTKGLAEQVSSD